MNEVDEIFDSKVEISREVLFQEINDETVLLDLNSECYFGLDKTATRIWQLLQETHELPEVYNIMVSEFEVNPNDLRKDLVGYLQELHSAGLITITKKS